MVRQGFIKLWRKLLDSQMWKNLNSKQRDVLVQCLLLANFQQNTWEWGKEMFKCEPGQFITSLESIKDHCSRDVSIQSVRTALLKLEKWQFLTNTSTKTGRLITVLNWDAYQNIEKALNKGSNKALTKSQQSSNKALTTIKNDKNDKNDKNKYLEFVFLSKEEKQKLIDKFGNTEADEYIDRLNNYIGSTGKKYKSHYHTILNWSKKEKPIGKTNKAANIIQERLKNDKE